MDFLIADHYRYYLDSLKTLIAFNTVYYNKAGVKQALEFCQKEFQKFLPEYDFYFDEGNNLIGLSDKIDKDKPILYLSAHVDTVPAEPEQWAKPYQPFFPYEDDKEIVGRGASDCKAGVAAELLFAKLVKENFLETHNIVFTISSHEENSGGSSKAIAAQLGKKLPIAKKTYLLTLENNVGVEPNLSIRAYFGEKSGVGILVTEPLSKAREFLLKDKNPWNPTSCRFSGRRGSRPPSTVAMVYEQTGGHSCSVGRKENILFDWLIKDEMANYAIEAGSKEAISVVPKIVKVIHGKKIDVMHEIVFDLRTTRSVDEVFKELDEHKLNYKIMKRNDWGYDILAKIKADVLYDVLLKAEKSDLPIKFELCPGSTDSGCIYKHIDPAFKDRFLPLTLGPGTGSQRQASPPRLTHGVNETFDKGAGLKALRLISRLIFGMGFFKEKIE